VLAVPKSTARS